MIVSGKISVKAILENEKREIHRVILLQGMINKDVSYIKRIVKDYPLEFMSREEIDDLTGTTSHGGFK